jgi:hypothetical protein
MNFKSLFKPETCENSPPDNEPFGLFSIPFKFDSMMAFLAQAGSVVMAETTFKRL